jgi:hypothetical protein
MFFPTGLLRISFLLPIVPTLAAPISFGSIFGSGSASSSTPTPISQETVQADFLRPAQFSRVAYCSSEAVTSWNCGAPCESLGGGIKVLQAGGGKSKILFMARRQSFLIIFRSQMTG